MEEAKIMYIRCLGTKAENLPVLNSQLRGTFCKYFFKNFKNQNSCVGKTFYFYTNICVSVFLNIQNLIFKYVILESKTFTTALIYRNFFRNRHFMKSLAHMCTY